MLFVVSFYSYKGGVGRTLALLNTAWLLAARGYRVALLDLDLEAPGLHEAPLAKLQGRDNERPCQYGAESPEGGFFEIVEAATGPNASSDDWKHARERLRACLDYRMGPPEGYVALIPARGPGKEKDYASWIQRFDWQETFFGKGGPGTRFLDEVVLRELKEKDFDYLLIDGRTGLTDVRLLTLIHLPDVVVFVTNLTQQSVRGTRQQLDVLEGINHAIRTMGQSDLRKRGAEKRTIWPLVVASPVPLGELYTVTKRVKEIEAELGRVDVQIDYLPFMATAEKQQILAQHVDDADVAQALHRFKQLVEAIVSRNPGAAEGLVAAGQQLNESGYWRNALAHFDELTDRPTTTGSRLDLFDKARLLKVRALLRGAQREAALKQLATLDSDALKTELASRFPELKKKDANDRKAKLAPKDLVQAWMATASEYLVNDDFELGRLSAMQATRIAKDLEETSRGMGNGSLTKRGSDIDSLFLLTVTYLCQGELSLYCGKGKDAEAELQMAEENCERLGTVPLLHCLILALQARAQLVLERPEDAATTVQKARGILFPMKSHRESNDRVRSSYARARVGYAEGIQQIAVGRGFAAQESLEDAAQGFEKENEVVSAMEVAIARGDISLSWPPSSNDWEKPWCDTARKGWFDIAVEIGTRSLEAELRLVYQARITAGFDRNGSEEDLGRLEEIADVDPAVRWLLTRERCKLKLKKQKPTEAREILNSYQDRPRQSKAPQKRSASYEELLLSALVELSEKGGMLKGSTIGVLRDALGRDLFRGLQRRAAQFWAVLSWAGAAGIGEFPKIEEPTKWLWHLPIAFAAPGDTLAVSPSSLESVAKYLPRAPK